jgi:penicillin-binding protein 2
MPGEERVLVDALGFATEREVLVEARNGFDLKLTLDYRLQKAAEDALRGLRGAFVAVDPRDGGVRAMVSTPSFDPRECVPVFPRKLYERYSKDPAKPLLNRAVAGQYAPGSTFKPLTALAALSVGVDPGRTHECCGYYEVAGMRIRCARTWGHGDMDLVNAIKNSCNPYFCEIGVMAGTNAIYSVCRKFGLGVKTGIDFPIEGDGLVPDAAEKAKRDPAVRWNSGDVAQTSIGQGLLLVTPLQMSLVAAGLGSGKLPVPHLVEGYASLPKEIDIPERDFAHVAEGMRKVVAGGTGRLAGERVEAEVMGKTGTAEVGSRANRRKNTWFIAYVKPTPKSAVQEPIAVALVIENGDTGGSTSAPKVGEILRAYYGESEG